MSKILEPTALATAMSPCPARATETEASASGTEVPAASTRVPITASGIPSAHPIFAAASTIPYEMPLIHTTELANDTRYQPLLSGRGAVRASSVEGPRTTDTRRSRIIRADGESRVARESDGFSSAAVSSSARTETSATGTNAA